MNRLIRATVILCLSLSMGFNIANAYTVGGNLSGTSVSDNYYLPSGFLQDSNGISNFNITYDSQVGPWVKNVTINDGMTGSALHYVGENLTVSGTLPWSGWYAAITTPSWVLSSNVSAMSGGSQLSGLNVSLDPGGQSVTLSFDPISSPSPVILNFAVSWTGAPGTAPDIPVIQFIQYPISPTPVPLPAAIWLLGSGLIGLIGVRRFRK
jgi:hypothetical protein